MGTVLGENGEVLFLTGAGENESFTYKWTSWGAANVSSVNGIYGGVGSYEFGTDYLYALALGETYHAECMWKTMNEMPSGGGFSVDARLEFFCGDGEGLNYIFFSKNIDTYGEWVKFEATITITDPPKAAAYRLRNLAIVYNADNGVINTWETYFKDVRVIKYGKPRN
jgi:hypothetical protein